MPEDDHEVMKYSTNIIEVCESNEIPYELTKKLKEDAVDNITKMDLDFGIVCGWRTLISPLIFSKFKLGLIAAHDSLLPKYRGFAPLNWAIINGEKESGVTMILINEGEVDSGDITLQDKIKILGSDYAIDVYEKIVLLTIELFLKFIRLYLDKKIRLQKQDESMATYCCKRIPADGKINWNNSSDDVYNLIRGIAHPYPGAFCEYEEEKYHIRKANIGIQNNKEFMGGIPGRVVKIYDDGIEVLCKEGTIKINEWEDKNIGTVCNPREIIKSITATLK